MSSPSYQHSVQSSGESNNTGENRQPSYMLQQYISADATIVDRISGGVKGSQSSAKKRAHYVSRAKKEIEKFDQAWAGK
ncbi:hypothetical protein GGS24DRAFT_470079 [Hypoxylon argillaceum]|nr:hypothetical protein GGS24DRAFT_470079 [Hypoxylon argillaceum]